jgi:hypothetical protein
LLPWKACAQFADGPPSAIGKVTPVLRLEARSIRWPRWIGRVAHRGMNQRKVAAYRDPKSSQKGSVGKVEIVQMKAVESDGVESDAFHDLATAGEKTAIERLGAFDPKFAQSKNLDDEPVLESG